MGMLVRGAWTEDDGATRVKDGEFDHIPVAFRSFITRDGSSGFGAERDRYHLYVAKGCPWAHRALIFRRLKKLEEIVSLTLITGPRSQGFCAADGNPHVVPGSDKSVLHLHEVYALANPAYTGRVTVPVLWDKKRRTIVNNESSEVIRMFNSEFAGLAEPSTDYYPADLRDEIDRLNTLIYENVNNGVYKAGFSPSQPAYEKAYDNLFDAFDVLEERLSRKRYLCGDRITEADWRLFPTLLRFDTIYHYAFKCNKRHLYQYPNLWGLCRELYQMPGISELCFLEDAKRGYYSNPAINPLGTVPKGPLIDFNEPHGRERLGAAGAVGAPRAVA